MSLSAASDHCSGITNTVRDSVVIDEAVVRELLTGFLAGGHVLLEDVPGTGKTLTARTLAGALGVSFSRIQFTPDLLPADITGSQVFDEKTREFEFRQGPLFAHIVLADEINRASPKTQSALLEAMAEGQVSVGNESYDLPTPFFVIATQNPIESAGTFELPEAQKDRFMIKTALGYPDIDGERELLDRRADRDDRETSVEPVCTDEEIELLRRAPEDVTVRPAVRNYIVSLSHATRTDDRVFTGVSPRGTERLFEASRALAVLRGQSYVTPDDIKEMARPVMAHRIALNSDARIDQIDRRTVIEDVLARVEVPKLTASG